MSAPDAVPGWLAGLLRRTLPSGPVGASVMADLQQEFRARSSSDPKGARRWIVREGLSVAFWSLLDRVRGHAWTGRGAAHLHGPGDPPRGASDGRLAGVRREIVSTLRGLSRAPGYSVAVVATLTVALGATLTVFTVVRGVLLCDLPLPDPDRVVRVDRLYEGEPLDGSVSFPDYLDWSEAVTSFTALGFWQGSQGTYVADGVAEVWNGVGTTSAFFDVGGVTPALGSIPGAEWLPGAELIALSTSIWRNRFGADPGLVGRTINFHGRTLRVVAVMPATFAFPAQGTDYWLPLADTRYLEQRGAGIGRVVGRVRPDRTVALAREEVIPLAARVDHEADRDTEAVVLRTFREVETAPVRGVLWLLMAAVLAVLAVASANVAGLALARVEGRQSELALRLSLGAGRARILRLLLGEQLVLSLVGGALGAAMAWFGVPALLALAPAELPRQDAIRLDPVVLATMAALAVVAGLVSGLLPAIRGARMGVDAARSGARGASAPGRSRRAHAALAVVQIAGAVVLLTAAGLLTRSFARLTSVDPGFRMEGVLTVEIGLPADRYDGAASALEFQRSLFESVAGLPGVTRVGSSTHLPFSDDAVNLTTAVEGEIVQGDGDRLLGIEVVNGAYFAAIGLEALAGQDLPTAPDGPLRVAVINEAAAEAFFPGVDPVGRAFSFDAEDGRAPSPESLIRVLGVVPDVHRGSLAEPAEPTAYFALADFHRYYSFITGRFSYLTVQVDGMDPYDVLPGVRAAVSALDPTLPLLSVATMEDRVRESIVAERFRTMVLGGFGLMAVVLALLGVYGVTSYGVRCSLRDVGVRMALGAAGRTVRGEVLLRALRTAAAGVALGVLGAWVGGPALAGMLFEVDARDPFMLVAVSTLAALACVLAAWLPAARASRVDPARVLRGE